MGSGGIEWERIQRWRGLRRVETRQAVFVCEIHEMINGSKMAGNRLVK